MEKYSSRCPDCTFERSGIGEFFCIRNTGRCESCLGKMRRARAYAHGLRHAEKARTGKANSVAVPGSEYGYERWRDMRRWDE